MSITMRQMYSAKTILIIGYQSLLSKILIRKLIKNVQYPKKIFLLQLDTKQDVKMQDAWLDSLCFKGLNIKEHVKFTSLNLQSLQNIGQINIVFNCFMPIDQFRIQKAMKSHIVVTYRVCQIFSKLSHKIERWVQYSMIYSHKPGMISESYDPEIVLGLPENKIKMIQQNPLGYAKDNFMNDLEAWQWSLKYFEQTYAQVVPFTTIIRTPILGPVYDDSEGLEGYRDKFDILSYLIYQVGNGFLTKIYGDKTKVIDFVPVDYVANYFLAVGWNSYREKNEQNLSNNQKNKFQFDVHNLSTSSRHPITLNTLLHFLNQGWRYYRGGQVYINKKWNSRMLTCREQLPLKAKKRIANIMDIKSWKIQTQKQEIVLQKKRRLEHSYQFFLENQWICESNKSIDIHILLSPQQQAMFPFNVNSIKWQSYVRLCIYGLKKYLLGVQVEKIMPNGNDSLQHQAQSYFSDIIWAFKKGKQVKSRSLGQMRNYILSTKRVKEAIASLVDQHMGKLQKTPSTYDNIRDDYNKIAQDMCNQMFSQYQMKSIRIFGWFLHKLFKNIYQKVQLDPKFMQMLQKRDIKTEGPLIIIPTHRSYIDFLIISYVFFGYGIQCPQIAAAEDFLNMAVVHVLLRKSGAFFIKRNQKKHKNLYKAIMTEYITKVLQQQHYLQFFIQGTRSRVGKMLSPKYGILSYIAKDVLQKRIPDAAILPVTINYEKVLEGESFTYELMGQQKVKQSLSRLLKAADVFKENYGKIYLQFCPPISIKNYFQGTSNQNFEEKLQILGNEIVYQLSDHLLITAPAIVSTCVLMHRKGVSDIELNESVNWLCQQLVSRKIKIAKSSSASSISINNTLELLSDVVTKSKKNMFQVELSFDQSSFIKLFTLVYYRNTLGHIFFEQSIITTSLIRFGQQKLMNGEVEIQMLYKQCCFLYELLENQYFLRYKLSNRQRFTDVLQMLVEKNIIIIKNDKIASIDLSSKYIAFYCSFIWPLVESYWITSLYLFKLLKNKKSLPMPTFLSEIQWFAQSLLNQKILSHLQAVSMDTIKNAVNKFKSAKLIQSFVDDAKVQYVRVKAQQATLNTISQRIKCFLKRSYAQSLLANGQVTNANISIDYPFLSKL